MEKIYLYILTIFTLTCSGCADFLNVEPENSVTYTNYFKTVQDAETLLAGIEFWVKDYHIGDGDLYPAEHCKTAMLLDVYDSGIKNAKDMEPGAHTSSPMRLYQTLEQVHMLLDNIHRFELPKETIHPYELQAHFYRALTYFHLAREFGSVPIIKNYKEYLAVPQSPLKDVLDEAEKSALIALELPKFEELTDGFGEPRNSKQYASKGAAAALLAQLYAWRAAVETKPEYWEEAEKYCTMIISGEAGNYALAENPQELCNTTLMGESSEGIWEILNTQASGEFERHRYPTRECYYLSGYPVRTESSYAPSPDLEVQFYKERAKRMFDKDDRRRDAYFYALDADTLYVVYDKVSGEMVQKYSVPEGDGHAYYALNRETWTAEPTDRLLNPGDTLSAKYDNTVIRSAFVLKYRNAVYVEDSYSQEPFCLGIEQNRVYWRLADIYLLRAECRAYQNDPQAADDLNEIRRRAYGSRNHDYSAAEGDIKVAIFREREKELLFEDHRWYDIVRNGWNHLHGHVDYDFIREELPAAYANLTDQDILDGALYLAFTVGMFERNEYMRQNVFWNKKLQ